MKMLNLTLHVWRQSGDKDAGRFETYQAKDINEHASFLEMLDVVNERLLADGKDPIAFDHDCREGICGMCSLTINGVPHGDEQAITTACQLHMRHFKDGDDDLDRALPRQSLPRPQGLWWSTADCLRPHHPGRRLRERAHRLGP